MKNKLTIGMVFSGGGVRGAAHAGVLKALEENNIEINVLSGSSAGAMAAALYSAGFEPKEIHRFFKENTNIYKWQNVAISKPGILDADKYMTLFYPWLNGHTFETLHKKLYICVTDILNGEAVFFSEGELVRPILASAAVPGIFSPVEIGDDWYVDGGTMNNFPVEPLIGKCDLLIGSFVSPKIPMKKNQLNSTLKIISRATDLSFLAASQVKFRLCDFIFNPMDLANFATFDNKKVDMIYEIGYKHACENMDKLLEVLNKIKESNERRILQERVSTGFLN